MSVIAYYLRGHNTRGGGGGGHYQRRGYCPGIDEPLADSIRGTHFFEGGGGHYPL